MKTRTPKQIEASRANGAKSRGPKTVDGKRRSSANSRTHGMWARTTAPGGKPQLSLQMLKRNLSSLASPHNTLLDVLMVKATVAGRRQKRIRDKEKAALAQQALTDTGGSVDSRPSDASPVPPSNRELSSRLIVNYFLKRFSPGRRGGVSAAQPGRDVEMRSTKTATSGSFTESPNPLLNSASLKNQNFKRNEPEK